MKTNHIGKMVFVFWLVLIVTAGWVFAAKATVIGVVQDNYRLVVGDAIYYISDEDKGNELAEKHLGARVEVTGEVEDVVDNKMITVEAFKILSD